VHPDYHRQGLGKALYGRLMPTLKAQGYHTLLAGITQPNEASVRLHESFGFEHIGTLKHAGWKLGQWHDVSSWQLTLVDSDDEPSPLIPPLHE